MSVEHSLSETMDWTGLIGILMTPIWYKIIDKNFLIKMLYNYFSIMGFSKAEYINYHTIWKW